MAEGIQALLNATEAEKEARGIQYTPREIIQQPSSWIGTYQRFLQRHADASRFLVESGIDQNRSSGKPIILLVGAGTSDYIGRALTHLLRQTWACEVWAVPSTDLLTNLEDFVFGDRPYLWISFSRSGESSEGLAVLEAAIEKYPNVRHLLVTCNEKSQMAETCAKASDRSFVLSLDESVNDRGLAMTSSFTNMVVVGHCLAHVHALSEYERTFAALVGAGERFLKYVQDAAASIAKEKFSRACFVGSGVLRAVALESALKLLELTAGKIQTMSESSLGLRHGPMSALDENTLFVSFLSGDPRRRHYELDLLAEIKRKQLVKSSIVVTPRSVDHLQDFANRVFTFDAPSLRDEYRAPVDVMLAQSLGLFSSLVQGLKPDCPSPNGAISRVVSHVNIYT